jgi:hypothetical protein
MDGNKKPIFGSQVEDTQSDLSSSDALVANKQHQVDRYRKFVLMFGVLLAMVVGVVAFVDRRSKEDGTASIAPPRPVVVPKVVEPTLPDLGGDDQRHQASGGTTTVPPVPPPVVPPEPTFSAEDEEMVRGHVLRCLNRWREANCYSEYIRVTLTRNIPIQEHVVEDRERSQNYRELVVQYKDFIVERQKIVREAMFALADDLVEHGDPVLDILESQLASYDRSEVFADKLSADVLSLLIEFLPTLPERDVERLPLVNEFLDQRFPPTIFKIPEGFP